MALERSRAQLWLSSELLKFNKQERSGSFICQGYVFPHYNDKYIINKGIAFHFELPSRQKEDMEMQCESNEGRSKSNGKHYKTKNKRRIKAHPCLSGDIVSVSSLVIGKKDANESSDTHKTRLKFQKTRLYITWHGDTTQD